MAYAADVSTRLRDSLSTLTPTLVNPPTPSPSSTNLTASASVVPSRPAASQEAIQARTSELRSTLVKLHPKRPITPKALADLVDAAFPPFQGLDAVPLSAQTEGVEIVTLAQLTIATHGTVLRILMDEARQLGEEDEWWAQVENDAWQTGVFLLQTTPSRLITLGATTVSRLREMTTAALRTSTPSPSLLALSTYRKALPPSLLVTSFFPHLITSASNSDDDGFGEVASASQDSSNALSTATRLTRRTAKSLFFLTVSPLSLTRQEIAQRRSEIRKTREDLASRIGELTLGYSSEKGKAKESDGNLTTLLSSPSSDNPPSLATLKSASWTTLLHLSSALAPSSSSSNLPSTPPPTSADFAHSLSYLLTRTLVDHTAANKTALEPLRRPPFLTRTWPYLLSIPVASLVIGRIAYNSRETLTRWAREAGETVKGFLLDWVVEPVRGILETVRGGEGGGMSIMGKESLKSDLGSLERMVLDFGRDEYKLSEAQLQELAEKVRVGDLTSVLKAWEQDIKSPIRSAVSGSLIRTLLIQVQKVKVDVALAMDGIEKMLKSQQLTFGFVGVAPSMLVLVGVGSWLKGFTRRDGGTKKRRAESKRCWVTTRQLDLLLSPPRVSATPLTPALIQGLLLLNLSTLRAYASSSNFPSKDTQLRESFLEDVRALEDEGAHASKEERRVMVDRMWRWGRALGWGDLA